MTAPTNNNRKTTLGHRHVWGGLEPFALRHADRRQHVYVCGQTGTGKSTLLKNLIIADIAAGEGIAVLDPHGELVEELLDYIPPCRSDHVVYFNPTDLEYPISYNLFAGVKANEVHLLASGIVSAFKSVWSASWGPRLEYLLFASVAALAECNLKTGNVSLLGIQRILTDDAYRGWVLSHVTDVAVRAFWLNEFAKYDARFISEMISPVQNKIGQLLMSPPLRNTLGQVRKKVDLRFCMDNQRIFLANLSKGQIGEDKANLLGALLVSQFGQAAFSRAELDPKDRVDFWLVIDEFQNYLTDSFASSLAENRKYKTALTLSHQHQGQLREDVKAAIFGNCGTLISFRVGESDAQILEREFGGAFHANQFTDLANYEVFVKLLNEGRYTEPFRGTTLAPAEKFYGRKDKIIARSRERYASARNEVEDKIRRWMKN